MELAKADGLRRDLTWQVRVICNSARLAGAFFIPQRFSMRVTPRAGLQKHAAIAQTASEYVAGIVAVYGIIGHYGAHIALALTRGNFDGNGNFTSTFVVNEPTPGPQREGERW